MGKDLNKWAILKISNQIETEGLRAFKAFFRGAGRRMDDPPYSVTFIMEMTRKKALRYSEKVGHPLFTPELLGRGFFLT